VLNTGSPFCSSSCLPGNTRAARTRLVYLPSNRRLDARGPSLLLVTSFACTFPPEARPYAILETSCPFDLVSLTLNFTFYCLSAIRHTTSSLHLVVSSTDGDSSWGLRTISTIFSQALGHPRHQIVCLEFTLHPPPTSTMNPSQPVSWRVVVVDQWQALVVCYRCCHLVAQLTLAKID